ncbi:uncharacterized protein DS421_15g501810 [Arachis hypogaea]|nr:uncharacterized protein DS421_15g501810 [Arachis hypogaea]
MLGDANACSMRTHRSDKKSACLNSQPANSGLFLTQFGPRKHRLEAIKWGNASIHEEALKFIIFRI